MIKLSSENENVQKFIDYVHSLLKKYKVKLILSIDSIKIGKNSVCGYFSESDKEIKIDISEKNWLEVLVHEFCHFLQYIEDEPTYKTLEQEENILTEFWEWVENERELNTNRKRYVCRKVLEMELNCEKRSIEMIRKFDLPIDINEYIFGAYVYIHYFNFVKKYRTWLKDDVSLGNITEIKTISEKYGGMTLEQDFKTLPKEYEDEFKKLSKMTWQTRLNLLN